MTDICADDGALYTGADHHTRRNHDRDNLRARLRQHDACTQLRILSLSSDEYRDRIGELVHEIILAGGNMADLTWSTHASPAFIASQWLAWVQVQLRDRGYASAYRHAVDTVPYRHVAQQLGIGRRFDDIITVLPSDHYNETDKTHV